MLSFFSWTCVLGAVVLLLSCVTAAETPRWEEAISRGWVVPQKDRLSLVLPWDSNRPERVRVCPAGETRQIWLDLDGHALAAGDHRVWVRVSAERLPREKTPQGPSVDPAGEADAPIEAPAPGMDLPGEEIGLAEQMETEEGPDRQQMAARLRKLSEEAERRNYWYRWRGDKKPRKEPLDRNGSFRLAVRQSIRAEAPLPEYVLWPPSPWVDYPPSVLPPGLESAERVKASLCRDEREPVCLAVTNLGELPLRFSVEFLAHRPRAAEGVSLTRAVNLAVEVWPVRLPPSSRMAVFTWNYGMGSGPYLDFLKRMKCNWFSAGNPDFTVENGRLQCDFEKTDKILAEVKQRGRAMFIFSALGDFNKSLKKQTGKGANHPHYDELLREYLTRWVKHMRELGWEPEDWAVQLWDEPGMKGHWDKDWVFKLIARAAEIIHQVEPQAQVMENPLMRFNKRYYDMIADEVDIWCPHGGTVYLTEDTRGVAWEEVKDLDPQASHRDSCLMHQVYLRRLCNRYDAVRWTYYQHRPDATRSPIGFFRHFPWKNEWMGFEGVSFWSSWYTTAGTLENPNYLGTKKWWLHTLKGMYGWREGVEDVQYLELLEDAVRELSTRGYKNRAQKLRSTYHRALKRVVDQGWWATDPWELQKAIQRSRQEIMEALVEVRTDVSFGPTP
jgi:hypothetical protein